MKTFITGDFLLDCEPARRLFHHYAKKMPIFDYRGLTPADYKLIGSMIEDICYNNAVAYIGF